MKPIPSQAVQEKFGKSEFNGYDGELIYGNPFAENVFNATTSFCMSRELPEGMLKDSIFLFAFDKFDEEGGFAKRHSKLKPSEGVVVLYHHAVLSETELLRKEEEFLNSGAEGIIIRDPGGKYKHGRSTLKEGILLKLKRFRDEEGKIVGFEEKMHNANEATTNELGYTERSSHKENLLPCNTLGALVVYSEKWGEFRIGTGFNDTQRQEIWDNREKYLDNLVKFKYFAVGVKDKPRFPVFLGFRAEWDV
jgi:DNA ligase-1